MQLASNIQWLHWDCCKTAKASLASQRTREASYMMLASSHPVAFSILMLQAILKRSLLLGAAVGQSLLCTSGKDARKGALYTRDDGQ